MALESIKGAVGNYGAEKAQPTQKNEVSEGAERVARQIDVTPVPVEAASQTANSGDEKENGKEQQYSEKTLKSAINTANSKMKQNRTRCEFAYNELTRRVSIKIYDKDTDEIVKEIPSEEALKMVEKIWELAGLMVDEKR